MPPQLARLAGVLYLGTIVFGVFAEIGARGSLVVGGDAAATARAIRLGEQLYRAGVVADVAMLACYIGVTALFFELFRPVSARLSRAAAAFSLIGIAVLAANTLLLLVPLRALAMPGAGPGASPSPEAAALLALRLHADGYDVSLVFFGIYCLMIGWLAWASGFLPRIVGALMGLAGLCYLVDSLADLGAPALARALPPYVMVPTLIGEGALALWLAIFGARSFGDRSAQTRASGPG